MAAVRRHIAEDPLGAVNALCLLPTGGVAVHDFGVPLAHVLADEGVAVRQPRDDVAEAVGDQDRCGRGSPRSFRCSASHFRSSPAKTTPAGPSLSANRKAK